MRFDIFTRAFLVASLLATWSSVGQESVLASVMYWENDSNIYRSNLDGTDIEKIYSGEYPGAIRFIDIDPVTEKIYAYGRTEDHSSGWVRRMNLDGSDVEVLLAEGLGHQTYGFALDVPHGKMYLGCYAYVQWANLDGSGLEIFDMGGCEPDYAHDFEVDSAGGKLYYGDAGWGVNGVRRTNLDGTNGETLVPVGITLGSIHVALDTAAGKMYYTQYSEHSGTYPIYAANLDGSNQQLLLPNHPAIDIEVDAAAGKIYWTTDTKIQRANLDGSEIENLVTLEVSGAYATDSLSLYSAPAIPEPSTLIIWSVLATLGLVTAWHRRR